MMFRRGLALCLVLGLASFARAQTATISFSPNGGNFNPNQVVNVDVLVTQGNGATKLVRYLQFDLTDTAAAVRSVLTLPNNHTGVAGGIKGFDFNSTGAPNCAAANSPTCGTGHFFEDELVGGLRPNIVAIAYKELVADANKQIELPNNVAVKVATITLTMPAAPGNLGKLNVVSATTAGDPDKSGELRYGFGITGDLDLVRLRSGAGLLGGISNDFIVPVVDGVAHLASALPGKTTSGTSPNFTAGVLSRTTKNEVRLNFDKNVTAPPAGGIRIREMIAGGTFGPDLSGTFTSTVTDTPGGAVDTARVIFKDNASTLTHRKWYQVDSVAGTWPNVGAFCLQFVVQAGDCQANNSVNAADLSCINAKIPTLPANAALDANFTTDINAATGIGSADLNAANAQIPSAPVNRPAAHVACP